MSLSHIQREGFFGIPAGGEVRLRPLRVRSAFGMGTTGVWRKYLYLHFSMNLSKIVKTQPTFNDMTERHDMISVSWPSSGADTLTLFRFQDKLP